MKIIAFFVRPIWFAHFPFSYNSCSGLPFVRGCLTFTDSSSKAGQQLNVRLRRTSRAGGEVFIQESYGDTWSGSGLIHHECGAWYRLSDISCGYSWSDTCQLDIQHTQGVNTQIFEYDFEIFSDKQTAGECIACAIGRYQNVPDFGEEVCLSCPSGKYGDTEGSNILRVTILTRRT